MYWIVKCFLDWNDESQKRLRPERKKAVGVKNALEASFSSSKRWIEKVKLLYCIYFSVTEVITPFC